jgi:hypothetical protein
MNSGPSHAKEYKVGVYPQYRMPRKGRTKPAAASRSRPTARRRARPRRGGVRPRCGSRARPPRAPPVRAARPPDTSVSTDHAASWTAYSWRTLRSHPSARAFGGKEPRAQIRRRARAGAPRLTRRGSATVPLPAAGWPATSPAVETKTQSLHPKLGSHPCVTPAECAAERLRVPPSFSAL